MVHSVHYNFDRDFSNTPEISKFAFPTPPRTARGRSLLISKREVRFQGAMEFIGPPSAGVIDTGPGPGGHIYSSAADPGRRRRRLGEPYVWSIFEL